MDSSPSPAEIERLKQAVLAAQQTLQETLRAFRRGAGQPPAFLREKQAPKMRADAFEGARVFADRHAMLAALAEGPKGAEVGVQHGNFSRYMLDTLQIEELHLFDMADHLIRPDVKGDARVRVHVGDSSTQLGSLPDASLDWIYVDGDHGYQGAMKDARAALAKARPGATIFFNDYTPWSIGEAIPYGVMAAVNEVVNEGHDMIGVALTPNGYFDVALRRRRT